MKILFFVFLIIAGPVLAAPALDPPRFRLGGSAQPIRYAVDLTIVPGRDNFHGKIDIDVSIQPSQTIWLNATGLTLEEASFQPEAGLPVAAKTVASDDAFIGLSLDRPAAGKGSLHISYQGRVSRNSSTGIFQLSEDGDWYVYNQFQPTGARRAFPCFDEPGFKVPWQITLHVPKDAMALSNTHVESELAEPGGMKAVRFKVSPPLPSYLVGLAVGRFQAVDAGRLGPTPIRIIVPRGQTGQASNAAIVIPQLLKFFEDYLASPFPYEKLDVLAMPIGESAVGNAGLIALPERKLLGNPARETAEHRRKLAESSAHQIAHQWFGGFVTAAWWNDTWLSEAFATWMQRKIPAAWRPEWGFDAAVVNARLEAMRLDRLFSARAVRQPIESNHDIANAFDGITREKGAAVIEMLEHWIGPERFRVGVRLYLKQHAWGNATGTDFASDMSNSAAQDIGPLLSGFLDQSGLPEIAMALKCGKPPSLEIRQERAQPVGSQAKPQLWRIPVCTAYVAGVGVHEDCSVVDTATADVDLAEAQACPAWLLPNDDVSGYYEIAYEGDLLERVLADGGRRLSVPERVGVLGDLNLQARAGDVPAGTVLSLVPRFSQENAPDVVETVAEIASLVRSNGMPGELREEGERFIRQQFGARALDLGWLARAGDSDDTRLLRQILVPLVASAGERPLIAEAGRLAGAWVKDRQAVTPEMSGAVLKVAAEFGDRELFNLLLSAATHERDHTVRHELLEALGSFRKPALATAALSQLLSKNFDPRESFPSLLFGPLADQETRGLPFEFVKRHLDSLLKILPRESDDDYAAVLPEVGRDFCDAQRRDQLQAFFADRVKDYTGGPRILAQTLEGIDLCVAARQRLLPEVTDFLKQQR